MIRFIKKTVSFILIGLIIAESVFAILAYTNLFLVLGYPGKEIYHSIFKSKEKNKSKKILLGDSVGNQIFPNTKYNDGLNSLASNQAIGMVGQYILLYNYLNAGNKVDKVFMLFSPFSFQNSLNDVYTFHYFLKPFDNSENEPLISETVKKQIKKIPYHQFSKVPHIFVTSWAPEFRSTDQVNFSFLSPVSKEYLIKIKGLSLKHHFELILLPVPVSIRNKKNIAKFDFNEFSGTSIDNDLREYFEKIIFLDASKFSDGIHLKNPDKYVSYFDDDIY